MTRRSFMKETHKSKFNYTTRFNTSFLEDSYKKMNKKKRVYILATTGAFLCLAIVMMVIFSQSVYVVSADGQPLGYVEKSEDYEQLVEQLKSGKKSEAVATGVMDFEPTSDALETLDEASNLSYTITNDMAIKRALFKPDVPQLDLEQLEASLNLEVEAAVIMVDGQDIAALTQESTAQEVIDIVVQGYTTDRAGRAIEDFKLQEVVEVVKKAVSAGALMTREQALNMLSTGYAQRRTHVVSRGDSLWSIGQANGMSVSDIKDCNPDLKSNLLMIGQKIAVEPLVPYIHVETKEKLTTFTYQPYKTEYVKDTSLYTWQSKTIKDGVRGKTEVVYDLTCVNGNEVDRTLISEKLVSEPITRVVAKGTKLPEAEGTGAFIWPVDGGGTISSYFGWTGTRYHHGLDIATPSGTSIFASDSGMVTVSTYSSTYGYYIVIDHGNGYSTCYAHNSKLLAKVGQKVAQGQIISKSGNTGNSTGPHLHFEIRKNGEKTNPLNYFK